MKVAVYTEKAPKPVGPYSQAICTNGWLFLSGQIPVDPITGSPIEGDFKVKVRRVLESIKAIVEATGGTLRDIVKVTVFLRNISRFQEFNEVYKEYFSEEPPARSVVEVSGLPRDSDLEVGAVAYVGKCR
ncbi:MAG: Rid family detoxifying hydrolase [Desulfurococcaceae archaeon]